MTDVKTNQKVPSTNFHAPNLRVNSRHEFLERLKTLLNASKLQL